MEHINLRLPYPPSTNTYWRHPTKGKLAGRHLISEAGRAYRSSVAVEVFKQLGHIKPADGRLAVKVIAYMPDRRRRDLDNILKALFDALTHAGLWLDDSQIDFISISRGRTLAGRIDMSVYEIDDSDDEE